MASHLHAVESTIPEGPSMHILATESGAWQEVGWDPVEVTIGRPDLAGFNEVGSLETRRPAWPNAPLL